MQTKRPKRQNPKTVVKDFNERFPVGSRVILRKDTGDFATEVRGAAFILGGHSAVAFFANVRGCYSIEDGRVRKDETHG